jgi:ABC-type lipoprotein export system ATPase subunit
VSTDVQKALSALMAPRSKKRADERAPSSPADPNHRTQPTGAAHDTNADSTPAAESGRPAGSPSAYDQPSRVQSLTVLAGHDKRGAPETFGEIEFRAGEVVCIVGATGSGKSRLLADIEWLAQADTPTGRSIRVNGTVPDLSGRYAGAGRLVAQLSQNMNFVMDATVEEFLQLHAESRDVALGGEGLDEIVSAANRLTGEPLARAGQLTELSGGQSRALMIADTALLSSSPIVLIDEIENAGIDRHRAIELLRGADKIVMVATHDPSLALSAPRRLVLSGGAVGEVRMRSEAEERVASQLAQLDALHGELRTSIRAGESLDSFVDDPRLDHGQLPRRARRVE